MPLIILDGPEKAGKTTIARAIIERYGGQMRHWGPAEPDDRVYLDPLIEDCATAAAGETVVWDRGWAAEHVYAKLLNRDRRLRDDPWLGEWLYGRVFQTLGVRTMVLGPSIEALTLLRDSTDLPVDPGIERTAFYDYARRFKWMVVVGQHTRASAEEMAFQIWNTAAGVASTAEVAPPLMAGPPRASVVVVGERRNETPKFPGAWLPFTTPLTMKFARMFSRPLDAAWTNASDCPPQALRHASTVLALGEHAQKWARYHVASGATMIKLAHPAYAFRFNTDKAGIARVQYGHELRRLERGGTLSG